MTSTAAITNSHDIEVERLRRKREVALGYRIFAALRWGDLGDGHITARDPERTDCMWLLRYPVGFESATIDDLVLVQPDGSTVDGTPINRTAYDIHHPIHAARPDIVGVAHTHTAWGTPFCATMRPLLPITQEACVFYENWASFDEEEVQVRDVATGARIADALGANQVVLLRNHGLLTTGAGVGETVAAFVQLERVTEALMKAPDARVISDDAARTAATDLAAVRSLEVAWDFLVRRHVGDASVVG